MRIGSLFSGAGGLDMAVEEVFGGEVIWQAEVDKAASKVLAYRFPCAPNLGDITQIDWKTVEPPDVLCLGFPCQDVSAAGKRAGIKDGTRSGLWSYAAEAIDQLRPPLVVIENVRGLLSAQAHRNVEPDKGTMGDRPDGPILRALGAVLGDLADLRYDAQWATVAASDVGAPHRRERVFILAADAKCQRYQRQSKHTCRRESDTAWSCGWCKPEGQSSSSCCGKVEVGTDGLALLPTPRACEPSWTSDGYGNSLLMEVRKIPAGLICDTAVSRGLLERSLEFGHVVSSEDDCAMPVFPGDDSGDDAVVVAGNGDRVAVDVSGSEKGHDIVVAPELAGTKHEPGVALLPTPNASDASGGGQHPDKRDGHSRQLIDYVLLLPTPTAVQGRNETSGRSNPDSQHHSGTTLNDVAYSGQWGKYEPAIRRWENVLDRPAPDPTELNKNGNPRLAAEFSSWMMGWPYGWVTDPGIGISRNDQLKIVGNGVCPQQAAAALRYLLTVAEAVA